LISPAAAIQVESLGKRFGLTVALHSVDLEIPAGQFVTLFGPNGAGKTTLVRCLGTLTRPTSGHVRVMGQRLSSALPTVRRRIGLVSHASFLYGALSPRENLAFYARMFAVPDASTRTAEVIERVGLGDRIDDPVHTFSRGMLQRCAIARALVHDPEILLFDEPFSGLDPVAADTLTALLRDAQARRRTVLMTSHDLQRGRDLADRVAILAHGRIVFDLPANSLTHESLQQHYQSAVRGRAQ